MLDGLASWLSDPTRLTPRGFCLLWEPGLLWLHSISDAAIGLAYFSIPFALALIMRRRPDLVFRPVLGLLAAFIIFCGAGHWLDVLTLWVPAYGIQGLVHAMTAATAIVTAIAVWKLMPQILALPSRAQVRAANRDLLEAKHAELLMNVVAREVSTARDELVTEMSQSAATEAALRESEERFNLLLHSNVTEALYLLDPDGNIESWNTGAERIKGYTAAEVIGHNFSMFFTPEDVASGEPTRVLESARDTGRFVTEAWRMRKDGTRFLARVGLDAIRRDNGTLRGYVKVTLDVTNQRIEEEQRRVMIEAAPNGMMIVDEAGLITLANSQVTRIFGYPDGALVGRSVEILVPEGFRASHSDLRSAFTSGRTDQAMTPQRNFIGRKQDGSPVTIEIMLSPVKTPRGRIVVASLHDVTERVPRGRRTGSSGGAAAADDSGGQRQSRPAGEGPRNGARPGSPGKPRQIALSGRHEPRASHPVERHSGLRPPARSRGWASSSGQSVGSRPC